MLNFYQKLIPIELKDTFENFTKKKNIENSISFDFENFNANEFYFDQNFYFKNFILAESNLEKFKAYKNLSGFLNELYMLNHFKTYQDLFESKFFLKNSFLIEKIFLDLDNNFLLNLYSTSFKQLLINIFEAYSFRKEYEPTKEQEEEQKKITKKKIIRETSLKIYEDFKKNNELFEQKIDENPFLLKQKKKE
eukprot:TRINITY_DN469_c0_g2_i4.p1 TRINITY_DN469_c0_g2~~TRINITY_DN469_c0_g2_i4.p1  ORF type:complete len:193 (+),score=21.84 TRINITY_DN469_c0_g2_i4:828-1406(+)